MRLYVEGLLSGIPTIFFVGPVLLTLLQASLERGFFAGFWAAVGIALSDILCVYLCIVGTSHYFLEPNNRLLIGLISGLILFLFGLGSLFRQSSQISLNEIESGKSFFLYLTKGFLVNFVNPFVFAFWIGMMGYMTTRFGFSSSNVLLFFSGCITIIFFADIAKVALADSIRPYLRVDVLLRMSRIAGVGLMVCGGFVLWNVIVF